MANSSFQKISTSEEAVQQNKLQTIKSRLLTFLNFLIIEARKRPFLSLLILLNILTGIAILNVGGRYLAMAVSMDFQLTQLIVEKSNKPKITNFTKLKQYKSSSKQNWKQIKKRKGEVVKLNECVSVEQTQSYYESVLKARSKDQKKQQQCQEYNYLNKKYDLDSEISQSRICIVAIASTDNNNLEKFLSSLNQQNYSNYHLHLINPISSDQSFAQKISQYQSISQRVDVYEGDTELGHLSQLDIVMRQQCHSGDIIISTDINKVLVGTQVLNLINRQYHRNSQLWFLYTNYLQQDKLSGKQIKGQSGQIDISYYNTKTTRDSEILNLTGHLRCFLYDLYNKIPIDYFADDLTGLYYSFANQDLITFALAEIAGESHTQYFDQSLYLQFSQADKVKQADDCSHERSQRTELTLRSNGKFFPLSTLKQKVKVNQKHEVSIQLLAEIVRKQQIFLECMKMKSPKFYSLS